MNKMLLLCLVIATLTGCSSQIEKQFMAGCVDGIANNKDACECIFEKIEEHYGEELLEKMNKTYSIPDGFMERTLEFAEQCR